MGGGFSVLRRHCKGMKIAISYRRGHKNHEKSSKMGPDPILAPGKASRKHLESDSVGESV